MTPLKSDFYGLARIYLVGMMGAGKSTIARLIAQRVGWVWVDTDACVERNSNMPVAEIFAQYGEEEFRRREWNCVRQTIKVDQIIVACGGGAPCHHEALELMLSAGTVIYLHANINTLVERLSLEELTRPLLTSRDISVKERLNLLLAERESVYRRAHFTIDTDGLSENEIAGRVLQKMGSKY